MYGFFGQTSVQRTICFKKIYKRLSLKCISSILCTHITLNYCNPGFVIKT